MNYIAIVTSLVSFFRCLGGILALTIMSSVVNNKVASAFPSAETSSGLTSLNAIQNLPPAVLTAVQAAFANAVRWAYIAILPFVCISAISTVFLREVEIKETPEEQAERGEEQTKTDPELGNVPQTNEDGTITNPAPQPRKHKPRIKIYGPIGAIIWCIQALGDKMGWRK
jgi:hypothetical protein